MIKKAFFEDDHNVLHATDWIYMTYSSVTIGVIDVVASPHTDSWYSPAGNDAWCSLCRRYYSCGARAISYKAPFRCSLCASSFYGITILQTVIYYKRYPNDPVALPIFRTQKLYIFMGLF